MPRIKGLPEWRITLVHAARNAPADRHRLRARPRRATLGGNVVFETVFSWPGLGRLLVGPCRRATYPLAQGAFFVITLVLITLNFLVDMLYGLLDPRVSHGRS